MSATEHAKQRLRDGQTITKKELALLYGISATTLKMWLKRIPGYRNSRNRIISANDLGVIVMFYGYPSGTKRP